MEKKFSAETAQSAVKSEMGGRTGTWARRGDTPEWHMGIGDRHMGKEWEHACIAHQTLSVSALKPASEIKVALRQIIPAGLAHSSDWTSPFCRIVNAWPSEN